MLIPINSFSLMFCTTFYESLKGGVQIINTKSNVVKVFSNSKTSYFQYCFISVLGLKSSLNQRYTLYFFGTFNCMYNEQLASMNALRRAFALSCTPLKIMRFFDQNIIFILGQKVRKRVYSAVQCQKTALLIDLRAKNTLLLPRHL